MSDAEHRYYIPPSCLATQTLPLTGGWEGMVWGRGQQLPLWPQRRPYDDVMSLLSWGDADGGLAHNELINKNSELWITQLKNLYVCVTKNSINYGTSRSPVTPVQSQGPIHYSWDLHWLSPPWKMGRYNLAHVRIMVQMGKHYCLLPQTLDTLHRLRRCFYLQ